MAYLDHAATTPMRQCAIDAWVEHAGALNPASQHSLGRKANAVLQQARETVAELLGADPVEVIFTGSGTEANNVAVQGLYAASARKRVVVSAIEHPAVLETALFLRAAHNAQLEWLQPEPSGHVEDLRPLDTPAAVAALMWANNETGAVQPVAAAADRAAASGTPLHVDAVQVVGKQPVDFAALGATTLAASAHKFGGPRGMGILLAKRSPAPQAIMMGGGQERGLRSGTVDVASAAASAAALREAVAEMQREEMRLRALRDELASEIVRRVPSAVLMTHEPALSGHAHLIFPGANPDALIMLCDAAGIEVSTGSACAAGVVRYSHVLEAMGVAADAGMGALRLTLGRTTTRDDVALVLDHIEGVVERARAVGEL